MTSMIFQHAAFFTLGGSNAISSIDLSNAYNGIAGYSAVGVGALTFISNWAGPIWWASAAIQLLHYGDFEKQDGIFQRHITILTIFTTSSLFSTMLACNLLRTHLFVWTVFSPKYLYSMAWAIGQHLVVNVLMGGLLFWIGSSHEVNN